MWKEAGGHQGITREHKPGSNAASQTVARSTPPGRRALHSSMSIPSNVTARLGAGLLSTYRWNTARRELQGDRSLDAT